MPRATLLRRMNTFFLCVVQQIEHQNKYWADTKKKTNQAINSVAMHRYHSVVHLFKKKKVKKSSPPSRPHLRRHHSDSGSGKALVPLDVVGIVDANQFAMNLPRLAVRRRELT